MGGGIGLAPWRFVLVDHRLPAASRCLLMFCRKEIEGEYFSRGFIVLSLAM